MKLSENYLSEAIINNAPVKDSDRQSYFIEQLKSVLFEEKGLTYCTVTFGCQMNARDSEKIDGILEAIGFAHTDDEEKASIILFNTCTIRENANEHLYGRLGHLKLSKQKKPDKIIAVCGCMMQEADEIEKIKTKYPYIDIIFGTHNFYMFPELLFKLFRKRNGNIDSVASDHNESLINSDGDIEKQIKLLRYNNTEKDLNKLYKKPVISVWKDTKDIVEELPSLRKYPFKQGVNIMYGCNNFCSYCIVPYVRGREKSRKPEDIYDEIKSLAKDNVKEIMLLGQNVNSYKGGITFPKLLKNIDDIVDGTSIERIRFMTSHPKDLSDELIEVMAESKHVCHQFHLPLQSGSSRILERMNRHYDRDIYLSRVNKLKAAMPDISLSTDIIVGFPGETEEDFLDTLDMIKRVRFDSAYTFIYSKREGTPAATYEDQIPENVVKDRFNRLLSVQNNIVNENLSKRTGSIVKVLFEEVNEDNNGLLTGRLENSIAVHVEADKSSIGKILDVRLTECLGFYYFGELING